MNLLSKYRFQTASGLPSSELVGDLVVAQGIARSDQSDKGVKHGVVEGWIAQELRRRARGLNGPLA